MQAAGLYAWLRLGVRPTLVLALAIGLATVWRGFRTGLTAPAKRRTQLLLLGSLLAFAPLLLLSLVPYALADKLIFVGRQGKQYFVVYNGQRVGPAFDRILLAYCCEPAI